MAHLFKGSSLTISCVRDNATTLVDKADLETIIVMGVKLAEVVADKFESFAFRI